MDRSPRDLCASISMIKSDASCDGTSPANQKKNLVPHRKNQEKMSCEKTGDAFKHLRCPIGLCTPPPPILYHGPTIPVG